MMEVVFTFPCHAPILFYFIILLVSPCMHHAWAVIINMVYIIINTCLNVQEIVQQTVLNKL